LSLKLQNKIKPRFEKVSGFKNSNIFVRENQLSLLSCL